MGEVTAVSSGSGQREKGAFPANTAERRTGRKPCPFDVARQDFPLQGGSAPSKMPRLRHPSRRTPCHFTGLQKSCPSGTPAMAGLEWRQGHSCHGRCQALPLLLRFHAWHGSAGSRPFLGQELPAVCNRTAPPCGSNPGTGAGVTFPMGEVTAEATGAGCRVRHQKRGAVAPIGVKAFVLEARMKPDSRRGACSLPGFLPIPFLQGLSFPESTAGKTGTTYQTSTAFPFKLDACWKVRATPSGMVQVHRPAELEHACRLPFPASTGGRLKGIPLPSLL